ncbi:PKD repeat protein [Arthrobacter sp. PvP102]|uniref:PKD domain-containing protein n=1 Tax=unclassified Arthrobacter TaxID=235627 RepID=UPI001B6223E3|nr:MULTISPECIES: PKD domain-containing protein [unclassified Arthrobacter]MBP1231564.1 PKD repeat protein [Arthrobacter sp. PvP103]MBP1236699.1 PKD repeat protein [Arthrobacter sp. PvP102]
MSRKIFAAVLAAMLAIAGIAAAPAAYSAPNPSVKVFDTANTITDPAWFVQAYNAGFRLYIMHSTAWGTCDPWYRTQTQLKMALDAGLMIAVYTRDPRCWQGGISAAGPYQGQLQFFALDVETGSVPVTRAMVDGVKGMGVRPVIYSGSGMWPQIMDSSTAFDDVPLWDTNAGSVNYSTWTADYLVPTPVPYGGWNTSTNMRIGVQQKFNQTLNGVVVDLNSFDATFLGAQPPANQPPSAVFTSSASGLTATFDGSASADPDGSLASYSWDFGDGSPSGTGAKPTHTYAAGGTYQVKLTVTDNAGATGSATNPVTLSGPAATVPAAPTEATAVAGNASAIVSWTAPNNGGSAITSYTVTPYVGSAAQAPVQVTGNPPATSATVTGLANGTAYTFTVSATNAVGSSAPSAATAAVTPSAPQSVVQNGGFESGLASWTAAGIAPPKPAGTAHSGSGSALLGVASGSEPLGDSSLSQSISVPLTGTSILSFWYQPHTTDAVCSGNNRKKCRWDWMEGQVRGSTGGILTTLFKLNSNSGTWTRVTADLSPFRGQTVTLWFNVHLDGAVPADNTWMYLDDVTVTNG